MAGGSDQQPQARLTREGAVFGTPAYMSPEQVRGQGAVDHRADLWALGCITYECLTGKTVWSTEQGVAMTFAQIANAPIPRPNALRPDLPPEFTQWFDKALNRDITKRFQTAREFGDELGTAFNQTPRASFHTGGDGPASNRPPPAPPPPDDGDPKEKTSPLGTRPTPAIAAGRGRARSSTSGPTTPARVLARSLGRRRASSLPCYPPEPRSPATSSPSSTTASVTSRFRRTSG